MRSKAIAIPLCLALALQGCGVPAQTGNGSDPATSQESAQPVTDNEQKMSDADFVKKLEDSIYQLIVKDLDENGNRKDLQVQDVKAVYLSKEYLEQYAYNTKETKFFGTTLGELEKKFDKQKYVFDIDESGKTVSHAVDDFDNTFDEVTQAALLGAGVILISVTIVCVTGGAPVTALVACTANSTPAITANQAHLALLAASSAIAIFDDGDVGNAAKDIAFDTGSDFVMQAIGGNAVA